MSAGPAHRQGLVQRDSSREKGGRLVKITLEEGSIRHSDAAKCRRTPMYKRMGLCARPEKNLVTVLYGGGFTGRQKFPRGPIAHKLRPCEDRSDSRGKKDLNGGRES